MELMIELINFGPSSFEEAAQHEVRQEAMVEEYDSIMKKQVWEVVCNIPNPDIFYFTNKPAGLLRRKYVSTESWIGDELISSAYGQPLTARRPVRKG